MDGPRIGYARLLLARNVPNHSTIPDPKSVISLGQLPNVPLIRPRSELSYRFEPHDYIYSAVPARAPAGQSRRAVAGVPGVRGLGGYREGAIPGTNLDPADGLI